MQRFVGVAPCRGRQFRPWDWRGAAHASPYLSAIGISRHDEAGRSGPAFIRELPTIGDGRGAWLRTASRTGTFRAAAPSARGTVKAAAPPAPRHRLHRIAGQLINKQKLDHGEVPRSEVP